MLKLLHTPASSYLVVGLVIGICFANYKILLVATILLYTIGFAYKKIADPTFNLLLIGLSIGFYAYHKQINKFKLFKEQIDHQSLNIIGIVTNYEKTPTNRFKHRLAIYTSLFSNQTMQLHAHKKIYIYTKNFPTTQIGDKILIENLRFNFLQNSNFENNLIKNKFAACAFTPTLNFKIATCCNLHNATDCATSFITRYKHNLLKKISSKMNVNTCAMFNSIFLGNKQHYKIEQQKISYRFQTWGIIHYLARSGLHLAIISTIWQTLCCLLRLNFTTSNIVVTLLVYIFYLLSWPGLPFERALMMIIGYRFCHLWMLQTNLLNILNISCIIALINNPISIFFLDFQLSFLLTYGLALFNELLRINKQSASKLSIAYKN